MTGNHKRLLRSVNPLYSIGESLIGGYHRPLNFFLHITEGCHLRLSILGNAHDHRTRTSRLCYSECLCKHRCYLVRARHLIIPLGDRQSNADDIRFLERGRTQSFLLDLSRYAYDRSGVHHRISNTGHKIGCTRACCSHTHADLAGTARIAFRRMDCSLLMPDKYMIYSTLTLIKFIIERHDTTTRISEDGVNSFFLEGLDYCLSAIDFHILVLQNSDCTLVCRRNHGRIRLEGPAHLTVT